MKFRPLHDRVVVRRIEEDTKTAGGIIIPDTAKEKPIQGEVIAVGPGGRDDAGKVIPLDLKPGDRVLFGKSKDHLIRVDDDLVCKTCGKRFEIPSHRALIFLEELEGLPQDLDEE